jgi:hypothetical protein
VIQVYDAHSAMQTGGGVGSCYTAVALQCRVSYNTVKKYVEAENAGVLADVINSWWNVERGIGSRVFTVDDITCLLLKYKAEPGCTLENYRLHLYQTMGTDCSRSTLCKFFKELGMTRGVSNTVPIDKLTSENTVRLLGYLDLAGKWRSSGQKVYFMLVNLALPFLFLSRSFNLPFALS